LFIQICLGNHDPADLEACCPGGPERVPKRHARGYRRAVVYGDAFVGPVGLWATLHSFKRLS